jgi:hypothetical protein
LSDLFGLTTNVQEANRKREIAKLGKGKTTHKKTPEFNCKECIGLMLILNRWADPNSATINEVIPKIVMKALPILVPELAEEDSDELTGTELLVLLKQDPNWAKRQTELEGVFGAEEAWGLD